MPFTEICLKLSFDHIQVQKSHRRLIGPFVYLWYYNAGNDVLQQLITSIDKNHSDDQPLITDR